LQRDRKKEAGTEEGNEGVDVGQIVGEWIESKTLTLSTHQVSATGQEFKMQV
jgi:hypothetical protein